MLAKLHAGPGLLKNLWTNRYLGCCMAFSRDLLERRAAVSPGRRHARHLARTALRARRHDGLRPRHDHALPPAPRDDDRVRRPLRPTPADPAASRARLVARAARRAAAPRALALRATSRLPSPAEASAPGIAPAVEHRPERLPTPRRAQSLQQVCQNRLGATQRRPEPAERRVPLGDDEAVAHVVVQRGRRGRRRRSTPRSGGGRRWRAPPAPRGRGQRPGATSRGPPGRRRAPRRGARPHRSPRARSASLRRRRSRPGTEGATPAAEACHSRCCGRGGRDAAETRHRRTRPGRAESAKRIWLQAAATPGRSAASTSGARKPGSTTMSLFRSSTASAPRARAASIPALTPPEKPALRPIRITTASG